MSGRGAAGRILVAEDDLRLGDLLEQSLSEAGWDVVVVHDGKEALASTLRDEPGFDVLLLDWMLPGMDGIGVCRRLRDMGIGTPVLVLTARTEVPDRVRALDIGADDYVPKPFDLDELLARLRALRRRGAPADEQVIQIGDLVLDPGAHRVRRGELEVQLSAREFDILQLLMQRAGRVVTRFAILDEVWDGETDLKSNVIDVYIASLRAKIDRPFDENTITTLRGVGYRIDTP